MKIQRSEHLFGILIQEGVPISLSVPFLIKARGLGIQDIAKRAGCSRELFGKSLRGDRTPPASLRRTLEEVLGVDPWIFSESRQ